MMLSSAVWLDSTGTWWNRGGERMSSASSMPTERTNDRSCTQTPPESHLSSIIEHWLVSRLAERLGLPATALDIHQPLVRYGLDSIVAIELVADLEDWLGCTLPLTLVWDCPTIAAVVQRVAECTRLARRCASTAGDTRRRATVRQDELGHNGDCCATFLRPASAVVPSPANAGQPCLQYRPRSAGPFTPR